MFNSNPAGSGSTHIRDVISSHKNDESTAII